MESEKQSITVFWRGLSAQKRVLIVMLTVSDLLAYLGISVIAPFFPKEANDRGVSNTVSGWVFGVFALTKALSCPVFGKLLPHIGVRFMYLSGMFVSACCTILFGACAYLPTSDGGVMFAVFCTIVRIVLALGMAAYVTAGFTIIATEYHEQITFVFSIVEAGVGLGFILGPSVGGLLYEAGGFIFPFAVLGVIQLCMLCLNSFIIPRRKEYEMNSGEDSSENNSSVPILSLVSIPKLLFIMLGVTTIGLMFGCLDASVEPGLRPHGVDTLTASLCFFTMACTYTLMSPVVGWLCQFFPAAVLELFGIFFMAIGELVICESPILGFPSDFFSLPLTFVALAFTGFFGAFVLVPSFEWMKCTAVERGHEDSVALSSAIGGLWNSANALGDFLGPVLAGMLLDLVGFRWGITIIVALSLPLIGGLIVINITSRLSKSESEPEKLALSHAYRYDKRASTLAGPWRTEDDSSPLLPRSKRSASHTANFRWQTLRT